MKRQAYILFILMLICYLSLPAYAENTLEQSKYTLLVYMVGSDLESQNGLASQDLQEMKNSYPTGDGVEVIVCAGGANVWHKDIDPIVPTIYRLTEQGMIPLTIIPTQSMTNPRTLATFLEYAYHQYPAQRTALVLWNHGGGPMIGFGSDELDNDSVMSCQSLQKALKAAPYQGENAFEWIGMDACLMGSLEVAALCRPFARYLIASEEVEMPCGWDYSFISELASGKDTPELAHTILTDFYDSTVQSCGGNPEMMPSITLTCVDLSAMDDFTAAFDMLSQRMDTSIDFGSFETLARSRAQMRAIGKFSAGLQTDLVDVGQLLSTMQSYYPEETETAFSALDTLLVETVTNNNKYCGVSLYFPYTDKEFYNSTGKQMYQDVSFSDNYRTFLDEFAQTHLIVTKEQDKKLEATVGETVELELSGDLVSLFYDASFLILADGKDNGYIQVYESPSIELKNNVLSCNMEPLIPFMMDRKTNKQMPLLLEKVEETESKIYYQAPALGMYFSIEEEDLSDFELDAQGMTLQILVDRMLQKATVIGAFALSDESDNLASYGKSQINLEEWTQLQSVARGKRATYNSNNQLLPYDQWMETGTIFGWELPVSNSLSIEMMPFENMTLDLVGQFVIRDVHGNRYASELIPLHTANQEEKNIVGPINKIWKNPDEALLLLDQDELCLQIQSIEKTTFGDVELRFIAENKTDQTIRIRSNGAATDGEQRVFFLSEEMMPGEKRQLTASLSRNHPYEKTVPMFSELCFEIEITDNDYENLFDPILCAVSIPWQIDGLEQEAFLTDKSPKFYLNSTVVENNDVICIEATDYTYASSDYERYYFRISNKTDRKIQIRIEEAYINEWMIDEFEMSKNLLPHASCLMYVENRNRNSLLRDGNIVGVRLSWNFVSDNQEKNKMDVAEISLIPNDRILKIESSLSQYGKLLSIDLFHDINEQMMLEYTFENYYERPVLVEPYQLIINNKWEFPVSLTPDYVHTGKKRRISEYLYNNEELEILLKSDDILDLRLCVNIYDAETNMYLNQTEAAIRFNIKREHLQ